MLKPAIYKFQYGKNSIILETGMIARQSNAAVLINMDDTTVLVTVVVSQQPKLGQNFFPLTVNYQERTYAAGKFPGGFFRREGRPSENETLISRLIDRPIRPLFSEGFCNEVQITATVVSVNPEINPDIVSIIGASAALTLSGIPFNGPIGAARVGYIEDKFVLNPNKTDLENSTIDLIVVSNKDSILMVESEAKILSEEKVLNAILYGHEKQQTVIHNIVNMKERFGKSDWELNNKEDINILLKNKIIELAESRIEKAYEILDKRERNTLISNIKIDVMNNLISQENNLNINEIDNFLKILEKKIVRKRILISGKHIDKRKKNTIRPIDAKVSILSRTHGSALFTRGETQALVTVTLGTERNAQNIDELVGERIDRFLLHYNFPSYCTGEIGILGPPKRREIGHGKLVKKSMLAVMPDFTKFPYTIRVVAEITESNGSSSMASVCGASLALMDAGVPIKDSVAGVSIGLVKEGHKFVILTDILGDEDYIGDMDFKIAGSRKGITALQMDIKTKLGKFNFEILKLALNEAKKARIEILNKMDEVIKISRNSISKFAPRIYTIKISQEKIRDLIGKNGSVIRALTTETDTVIDVDNDGTVRVSSKDKEKARKAIYRIKEITEDIEIGNIYTGIITRIVDFGAFISIGHKNGKEGLVHISKITNKRVIKVEDYLKVGQKILVKVIEIDRQGRIRLSIKDVNTKKNKFYG